MKDEDAIDKRLNVTEKTIVVFRKTRGVCMCVIPRIATIYVCVKRTEMSLLHM